MRLVLERPGQRLVLASRVERADTLLRRMVGLLGRSSLADGEALILPRCRAIHTCGMRFAIDVVFVDVDWRVAALKPQVPPWRIVGSVREAWGVLEMAAGTIARFGLVKGDRLAHSP